MGGPRVRAAIGLACACLVLVACGDDGDNTSNDEVERAQARVEAAKRDLVDARDAAEVAATEFCDQARDYITALDRYGDVLASTKPTVGDVRDAATIAALERAIADADADEPEATPTAPPPENDADDETDPDDPETSSSSD